MDGAADLVLTGGEVLLADEGFSSARALAVRGGVVVAVGAEAHVREWVGRRTEVIDVRGRTVLPGINDSHLHGCAFGLSRPPLALDVGHPAAGSIADVAATVARAAAVAPPGTWIQGIGWDTGYLAECRADPARQPTRLDLDQVSPRHPVCLQDFSGHVTWANSLALELAGVTARTAPPDGGVITRDAAGHPTGLLAHGAQDLVQRMLPPPDNARRVAAIRAAIRVLHTEGITSFTEPGLGPGGSSVFGGALAAQTLDAYAGLARDGGLAARVTVLWLPSGMSGARAADVTESLARVPGLDGVDERRLRVTGIKVFADGTPPSRTSWMYEAYAGGGHGCLCVSGVSDAERAVELAEIVRRSHAAGYQVGVHVTGDRAIDAVVESFDRAIRRHPRDDPRHYVIHGDFVSARSLATLASRGLGINMNPPIKWAAGDLMAPIVGPGRSGYQWPVRSAVAAGVRVMSSSDAPVTYPNWRQGVATMMLRESRASGTVMGRDQCVGLDTAIRSYTANPAWQDFSERWKGSLEVGKVADICVVDGLLRRTDPHDIPGLPVVLTAVGGEIVHNSLP